jgi:hypothetical protein
MVEKGVLAMVRYRCPECGTETQLEAQFGGEIVSVYCLKHAGGADAHLRPVYMTMVTEPATKSGRREWAAAAA